MPLYDVVKGMYLSKKIDDDAAVELSKLKTAPEDELYAKVKELYIAKKIDDDAALTIKEAFSIGKKDDQSIIEQGDLSIPYKPMEKPVAPVSAPTKEYRVGGRGAVNTGRAEQRKQEEFRVKESVYPAIETFQKELKIVSENPDYEKSGAFGKALYDFQESLRDYGQGAPSEELDLYIQTMAKLGYADPLTIDETTGRIRTQKNMGLSAMTRQQKLRNFINKGKVEGTWKENLPDFAANPFMSLFTAIDLPPRLWNKVVGEGVTDRDVYDETKYAMDEKVARWIEEDDGAATKLAKEFTGRLGSDPSILFAFPKLVTKLIEKGLINLADLNLVKTLTAGVSPKAKGSYKEIVDLIGSLHKEGYRGATKRAIATTTKGIPTESVLQMAGPIAKTEIAQKASRVMSSEGTAIPPVQSEEILTTIANPPATSKVAETIAVGEGTKELAGVSWLKDQNISDTILSYLDEASGGAIPSITRDAEIRTPTLFDEIVRKLTVTPDTEAGKVVRKMQKMAEDGKIKITHGTEGKLYDIEIAGDAIDELIGYIDEIAKWTDKSTSSNNLLKKLRAQLNDTMKDRIAKGAATSLRGTDEVAVTEVTKDAEFRRLAESSVREMQGATGVRIDRTKMDAVNKFLVDNKIATNMDDAAQVRQNTGLDIDVVYDLIDMYGDQGKELILSRMRAGKNGRLTKPLMQRTILDVENLRYIGKIFGKYVSPKEMLAFYEAPSIEEGMKVFRTALDKIREDYADVVTIGKMVKGKILKTKTFRDATRANQDEMVAGLTSAVEQVLAKTDVDKIEDVAGFSRILNMDDIYGTKLADDVKAAWLVKKYAKDITPFARGNYTGISDIKWKGAFSNWDDFLANPSIGKALVNTMRGAFASLPSASRDLKGADNLIGLMESVMDTHPFAGKIGVHDLWLKELGLNGPADLVVTAILSPGRLMSGKNAPAIKKYLPAAREFSKAWVMTLTPEERVDIFGQGNADKISAQLDLQDKPITENVEAPSTDDAGFSEDLNKALATINYQEISDKLGITPDKAYAMSVAVAGQESGGGTVKGLHGNSSSATGYLGFLDDTFKSSIKEAIDIGIKFGKDAVSSEEGMPNLIAGFVNFGKGLKANNGDVKKAIAAHTIGQAELDKRIEEVGEADWDKGEWIAIDGGDRIPYLDRAMKSYEEALYEYEKKNVGQIKTRTKAGLRTISEAWNSATDLGNKVKSQAGLIINGGE